MEGRKWDERGWSLTQRIRGKEDGREGQVSDSQTQGTRKEKEGRVSDSEGTGQVMGEREELLLRG